MNASAGGAVTTMKKGENTVRYDIVMVTYNSMKWLRACVAALAAVQYPLEELHLVFADNGSTDGTLEELRRMAGEYPAFGGFTVAENGANLGFGAACNRGAAKGSAPLLFFLNLDTEVWPDVFLRLDEAAVRAPQETPLISVIVRTCGRPQTLKRTLESLRWQTYRNFEIIVAEDGPPAAREMVERDFAELPIRYLNDGRFHGRAANGNRGLAAARGALCNFLDDDDFFYPDHLELLAGVLCAHPEADLVLGSAMAMFVAKDGTVTEVRPMVFDRIDRFTMCQNCRIPIQTVLFRRSLFERYGGLIETLEAHEDWGMWLKYLEHGRRITPHAPDVRRATSLFVQPAAQSDAAARMEAYRKSDADFYSDASLCFNVTLADMRRYYDDMIADMRCLEARGELHEFLEQQAKRGE